MGNPYRFPGERISHGAGATITFTRATVMCKSRGGNPYLWGDPGAPSVDARLCR
jgi:hypothetical protein